MLDMHSSINIGLLYSFDFLQLIQELSTSTHTQILEKFTRGKPVLKEDLISLEENIYTAEIELLISLVLGVVTTLNT